MEYNFRKLLMLARFCSAGHHSASHTRVSTKYSSEVFLWLPGDEMNLVKGCHFLDCCSDLNEEASGLS